MKIAADALLYLANIATALTLACSALMALACGGDQAVYKYPIVLKGQPELRGVGVDRISGSIFRNGQWSDIPLQVEEVNAEGDYVLSGGLPFTRDTDDGLFDAGDEIALMGEDLGTDFEITAVPQDYKDRALNSWKIKFCRDHQVIGFLLLQNRREGVSAGRTSYVTYNAPTKSISTEVYQYNFHNTNPVLLGEVFLNKDGKKISVIESSQFLMPLRTPFFVPNLNFRDSDFTSVIESWQSGPVRTIIAVGVKYTTFLSLFKLHLFSELVFYKNRFVVPTKIEFIFSPKKFLKPGSGVSYVLKLPAEQNWTFESNLAPVPSVDPDLYVKSGPRASTQDEFFAIARGRDGALVASVRVDEKAKSMVPMPLMLKSEDFKSERNKDNWPWLAKQNGDLGVFIDFSNVEKGLYNFGLDLLLSTKADERFADYGLVDTVWHQVP